LLRHFNKNLFKPQHSAVSGYLCAPSRTPLTDRNLRGGGGSFPLRRGGGGGLLGPGPGVSRRLAGGHSNSVAQSCFVNAEDESGRSTDGFDVNTHTHTHTHHLSEFTEHRGSFLSRKRREPRFLSSRRKTSPIGESTAGKPI